MIAFVGSNPAQRSTDLGAPFAGSRSYLKLIGWVWEVMPKKHGFKLLNVANVKTPGNRPLKVSEFDLVSLREDLRGFSAVVALGNTASRALKKLGVGHFQMPHPSGRNRKLNDKKFVDKKLAACKDYLKEVTDV